MKKIFYDIDFYLNFCLFMSTYLGQNFLKDSAMRSYIATAIEKMYHDMGADALMEIGPGKWAITKKIKDITPSFFVVEKDATMEKHLLEVDLDPMQIVFWDFLEVDVVEKISAINKKVNTTLAVWNLPYYITSPIFRKLFCTDGALFLWGIFMIQDEVGQKIVSEAEKKSYLWWLLNWGYEVKYLKMVPPKCFSPAPKVKSCLVKMTRKAQPENVNFEDLELFLNAYCPYSRKTLGKIQKINQKQGNDFYQIPEELKTKRLEELNRDQISLILWKYDS